jgi:catechol 2,3-dioxygenase-like lactoylglutathione lyase family enzyme
LRVVQVASLDHLVLTVASIDEAVSFYTRVLGMTEVIFGEGRRASAFGVQKLNLHQAGSEFEPKAALPTPGSADMCFVTDDDSATIAAWLDACGVAIEEGPVTRTGARGPITSFYVRDPDGNLVELATYRPPTVEGEMAPAEAIDAVEFYERGGEHDSAGREEEAIPPYEQALAAGLAGELRARCLLQLGSSLRNVGRLDEAVSLLQSARSEFPEFRPLRAFLALALHSAGRDREALRVLLEESRTRASTSDRCAPTRRSCDPTGGSPFPPRDGRRALGVSVRILVAVCGGKVPDGTVPP